MNSKKFLLIIGVLWVMLGIAGYIFPHGVVLENIWQYTTRDNTVHIVTGVMAISSLKLIKNNLHKAIIFSFACIAFFSAGFDMINEKTRIPLEAYFDILIGIVAVIVGALSHKKKLITK